MHPARNPVCNPEIAALFTTGLAVALVFAGCRNHQYAHVLKDDQRDMVGSHEAGAETFNVLVDQSVAQLLTRQSVDGVDPATGQVYTRRICFAGIENRSSEDIGDFKDQLFEQIDSAISSSGSFQTISPRYVEQGLRQLRLVPEDLMIPAHLNNFQAVMEQNHQPMDYLLFARLTSGTTENNASYQRDYLLTLELVNVNDGSHDKESARIRKGYHTSRAAKWSKYSIFK